MWARLGQRTTVWTPSDMRSLALAPVAHEDEETSLFSDGRVSGGPISDLTYL